MARKNFTRKTRKEIIDRANGVCEGCGATLKPGEGDVDHIVPTELSGDCSASNGQLLCNVCHKIKTAKDVRGIRKADRARDKATGAIRPKQSVKSRGFAKTEKQKKEPLPDRMMPEIYRRYIERAK